MPCSVPASTKLNWVSLIFTERTYAAKATAYAAHQTAYAVQPTAYAAQPEYICESLFWHCPTSIFHPL